MSEGPGGAKPINDVYTILLMAAATITIAATVFIAVRHQQLFGSWNPFSGA